MAAHREAGNCAAAMSPDVSGQYVRGPELASVHHLKSIFRALEVGRTGIVGSECELATCLFGHPHECRTGNAVARIQFNRNPVSGSGRSHPSHAVLSP